jgi:hypothetical protein
LVQESRKSFTMTEYLTELPTPDHRFGGDTLSAVPPYMTCQSAESGMSTARTNSRKLQHWARDLDARLAEHAGGRGARLLQVAQAAGITWTLARTWAGGRTGERQLKRQGGASRCCPQCGVRPRKEATQMTNREHARAAPDGTLAAAPDITRPTALGRTAASLAVELQVPHPDPWLAARGWHVHRTGVYVRDPDREAGQ